MLKLKILFIQIKSYFMNLTDYNEPPSFIHPDPGRQQPGRGVLCVPDDAAGGAAREVWAEPVVLPEAVHRQGTHQDHHASPG